MKKTVYALVAMVVIVTIYSLINSSDDTPLAYVEGIKKERKEKDEFMSKSAESPFRVFGDTTVKLNYYPIDPNFKLMAKVDYLEKTQYVTLASSDGSPVKYRKYAYAHFKLNGEKYKLLILQDPDAKQGGLFTAFADETSAIDTYGAGRYLDLDFRRANRIVLDFNKAYNPYCMYNSSFSCPFPPKDNVLSTSIKAGEKTYP